MFLVSNEIPCSNDLVSYLFFNIKTTPNFKYLHRLQHLDYKTYINFGLRQNLNKYTVLEVIC